jgi:hypothetical protein
MEQPGMNETRSDVQKVDDIDTPKPPNSYDVEAQAQPAPLRDVDVPKPPGSYPTEGEG